MKTSRTELRRRAADARQRAKDIARELKELSRQVLALNIEHARKAETQHALRAIEAACRAHPVTEHLHALRAEMNAHSGRVWALEDDQRLVQALAAMPVDRPQLQALPRMLDIATDQVHARIDALITVFGGTR